MARMLFLRDIDADVQLRCLACGHGGVLPRAMLERRFGPNYPVLSIAPHYRCSRCDSRDIESRPILVEPPAAANEEPSFDAPLAALQGLLASFRGTGRDEDEPEPDEPEPSPPARRAEPSPPAAVQPTPAMPVRAKPVPPTKPLAELVADGPPDDDADPLWEPVSLADMAARLSRAEPPVLRDDPAAALDDGWDDGEEPHQKPHHGKAGTGKPDRARDDDDAEDDGADETLTALHRLLAQSGWNDDPPDQGDNAGRRRSDAFDDAPDDGWGEPDRRGGRSPAFDADDPDVRNHDQDEADEPAPAVFSHKALVRDDFEDDFEDEDEADTEEAGNGPEDGPAGRWSAEDEPSDDDILSFAIRDPEKPAARPVRSESFTKPSAKPQPAAAEPLDFDQHRAERRAQRPPPPADDEDGFDRTLAALRSMIEDAASEPPAPPTGKPPPAARRPAPAAPAAPADDDDAMDAGAMDEDEPESDPAARSWPEPTDGWSDEPPRDHPHDDPSDDHDRPAPGRRSAQEREIEEAMKALRTLVEEDSPPEPPLPKPRAAKARPAEPPAERRVAEAPPADAKPGKPAAGHEPTPLSKTIAALRGMLELDGRRKR